MKTKPPIETPDHRYIIVRDRLWRKSDPSLSDEKRQRLVDQLMSARRKIKDAVEPADNMAARQAVDSAKKELGERGPVWWKDGTPDFNRHLVHNTPYAHWYADWEKPEN